MLDMLIEQRSLYESVSFAVAALERALRARHARFEEQSLYESVSSL